VLPAAENAGAPKYILGLTAIVDVAKTLDQVLMEAVKPELPIWHSGLL
jgi:hypothetical protein